jgi:hypothetical protein
VRAYDILFLTLARSPEFRHPEARGARVGVIRRPAGRAGAEASDMLKYFSERILATLVFSKLKMIINISSPG